MCIQFFTFEFDKKRNLDLKHPDLFFQTFCIQDFSTPDLFYSGPFVTGTFRGRTFRPRTFWGRAFQGRTFCRWTLIEFEFEPWLAWALVREARYVILLVFKTYRVAWLLCQQPPTYTGFFSLLDRRQTFLAPLRHRTMQQNTKVRQGLWDVYCMYKGQ